MPLTFGESAGKHLGGSALDAEQISGCSWTGTKLACPVGKNDKLGFMKMSLKCTLLFGKTQQCHVVKA